MTPLHRFLVPLALLALTGPALAQRVIEQPVIEEVPAEESEDVRPGPPPPLPDLADPNSRAAEPLGTPGPDSGIPKALRGSGTKAGGPANDLNSGGRPAEPALPRSDLARVLDGRELFHGNYCGAGQRGPDLPPTDALDAACMRHDACYEAAAYRSCACDATLKREAARVADRPDISPQIRQRALSVTQAADLMQCKTP